MSRVVHFKDKRTFDRIMNFLSSRYDGGYTVNGKMSLRVTDKQYNELSEVGYVQWCLALLILKRYVRDVGQDPLQDTAIYVSNAIRNSMIEIVRGLDSRF